MKRLQISVALLSVALLAFQFHLMQILSIAQWHHFASMVISVALLGFGAGGTVLTLARDWFKTHASASVPLSMTLSGIAMAVVVPIAQFKGVRFDSMLIFVGDLDFLKLLGTYFVFFVPFFFGALALGIVFTQNVGKIGTLYFSNLLGSGIGALLAVSLMWQFGPQQLPPLIATLPLVGAMLILPRSNRSLWLVTLFSALLVSSWFFFSPPRLILSEYKALSRTLNLPDARVIYERNSPYGLVQVVASSALRYAPGLSLSYRRQIPSSSVIYNNGDWFGPIADSSHAKPTTLMNSTTACLPYRIGARPNVLVLQAGTGENVALAIANGARTVVAAEAHGLILSSLQTEFAGTTDSLYYRAEVRTHQRDPRSFLQSDTSQYDLIVLPMLGAFGGTSGLYALQEQYLLTIEAFEEMWKHLTPDGVISISSWMDFPHRNTLKALATIVEMLSREGISNPSLHIAAVRSWGTVTFVAKRSALSKSEIGRIRAFCDSMLFDPLLIPDASSEDRARFNQMSDMSFFKMIDDILGTNRSSLYASYDFHIKPATDDKPYFSQFLRLRSVPRLREVFGERTAPFLELGYLLSLVTLGQVSAAAFLLIIFPLLWKKRLERSRLWTMAYFGSLGCGYMFVEMVLIQRFILYFGHAIYAAAAVIGVMLVCSGAGSLVSSRFKSSPQILWKTTTLVAVFLILYAMTLTQVLHSTIALAFQAKVVASLALIGLPAFIMGLPFPLGLRLLWERNEQQIAWAWGINGCMSVVSAVLAAFLALEWGFFAVMMSAAAFYGVAAITNVISD